ncbi:MAG: glycosyltransferase [Verrucomicrobia bacterium]|nr:glycosyltransferase [Verrucomicrobiota bacterium]
MHILREGMRARGCELTLFYTGALNRIGGVVRNLRAIRSRSRDFDICHAQFGSMTAFVSRWAACRRVVSIRGSDWHRYRNAVNRTYAHSALAVTLTRASLPAYEAVVVMSHRLRREVGAFLRDDARCHYIPDPVDIRRFVAIDETAAPAVDRRCRQILFTTLSRQNPIKRIDLALNAIEILQKRGCDVELRVASGVAHEDMPRFVAACDMVLCTSLHEGWPNSIKEALAAGLPFVSTDVSDLAEIAARDSRCRVCAPAPLALADAVEQTLREGKSASLRRHVEHMAVDTIAEQLIALYQQLMRAPTSARGPRRGAFGSGVAAGR